MRNPSLPDPVANSHPSLNDVIQRWGADGTDRTFFKPVNGSNLFLTTSDIRAGFKGTSPIPTMGSPIVSNPATGNSPFNPRGNERSLRIFWTSDALLPFHIDHSHAIANRPDAGLPRASPIPPMAEPFPAVPGTGNRCHLCSRRWRWLRRRGWRLRDIAGIANPIAIAIALIGIINIGAIIL